MTTPSQTSPKSALISKIVVVGLVLGIIAGVGVWNAWDYFGTEGLNPKKVKLMAKTYEVTCFKKHQDQRACKRHIGRRHRLCLKSGVKRDATGKPSYHQDSYNACMQQNQDGDVALERW